MLPLPAAGAGATGDTTMSSTQHQLIEQCATRLRGIVEALDNIHDNTPQRWSTDLDDVHSSAESLLAMINDQASNQADLAQPSPKCTTCGGAGMVDDGEITCSEGGIPYENGPVKCVKDCPSCKAHPSPTQPEDAPVIGCLCGMPMTEGHHSPDGCCNLEEFAPQAQAEQAEAERPEQPKRYTADVFYHNHFSTVQMDVVRASDFDEFAAQHERIVGALRFERQQMDRAFTACINERDAANARLHEVATACATAEQERDAALARVAGLEMILRELNTSGLMQFSTADEEKAVRAALSGAQAQHSVPEWTSSKPAVEGAYWVRGNGLVEPFVVLVKLDQGELWCNLHMRNTDTNFGYGYAVDDLSSEFEWCGPLAAATGKSVPQAWLDVQAERRRQVEVEGWTPEHDDAHSHGEMARAAACYALAGSSAPNDGTAALLVSLAWPWDEQWWKPTSARRDLVKTCALGLAEIERLDRATAGGDA